MELESAEAMELDASDLTYNPEQVTEQALNVNARQQDILRSRLSALQTRLRDVDNLISEVDVIVEQELPNETSETNQGAMAIATPGSFKPVGILTKAQLVQLESPFLIDAQKRQRYLDSITPTSMTTKEQRAIRKQVIIENKRLWAMEQIKLGAANILSASNNMSDDQFLNNIYGLDWSRIAMGVSQEIDLARSPSSCRIRWINDLHPQVNKEPWSGEEKSKLHSLVSESPEKPVNWVAIAVSLGTKRTPYDCLRQCLPSTGHQWTPDEDEKLLTAVSRYGDNNWTIVALATSENVNATQCASRYQQLIEVCAFSNGPWTVEEDDLLRQAIARCGTSNFQAISRLVYSRSRNQCRERWNALHNNGLVSARAWTHEEDEKLLGAIEGLRKENGEIDWSSPALVAGRNRTESDCVARYETLVKEKNYNPLETPQSPGNSRREPTKKKPTKRQPKVKANREQGVVDVTETTAPPKRKPRPLPRKVKAIRSETPGTNQDNDDYSNKEPLTQTRGSQGNSLEHMKAGQANEPEIEQSDNQSTTHLHDADTAKESLLRKSSRLKEKSIRNAAANLPRTTK